MKFDKVQYINEMKAMIDQAVDKLKKEKTDFEIFTASIWTDPNSTHSSIGFESKINSDKQVEESNEWSKKYYDKYVSEGDFEQAKLFEPTGIRNDNPADFELSDFVQIENSSFENNWEKNSDGKCWNELEPILKEMGEYAFIKLQTTKTHSEFELSVNGRNDWYEFIWKK